MEDNAGRYFIYNGGLEASTNVEMPSPAGKKAVYEVIRIIDGVPLFLLDHYFRMEGSIKSTGGEIGFSSSELLHMIGRLVKANGNVNCNVKVMAIGSSGGNQLLMYICKSYYPPEEAIKKGVKVGLLRLERQNPNIKLINHSYREAADKRIEEGNYFEVLLCSNDGNITEGSKSNVFFVKENKIYTAPGSYVLKGITRKYVMDACEAAGYEVLEAFTAVDSLNEVEGLFLSGTSIKVLPVSQIEDRSFPSAVNPVIAAVREGYEEIIKKYIERDVNIW